MMLFQTKVTVIYWRIRKQRWNERGGVGVTVPDSFIRVGAGGGRLRARLWQTSCSYVGAGPGYVSRHSTKCTGYAPS